MLNIYIFRISTNYFTFFKYIREYGCVKTYLLCFETFYETCKIMTRKATVISCIIGNQGLMLIIKRLNAIMFVGV